MSVHYSELTPLAFRERIAAAPIAYLPLGTLEWHGEHLPLGADGLQSQGFFARLAERVGGIVMPMLFLGPDRVEQHAGQELYGMDVNGVKGWTLNAYPPQQLDGSAYWVDDKLFAAICEATVKQLARVGFRIVVGHGHGPSSVRFADMADLFKHDYGIHCCNCFGGPREDEQLGLQCDHAGKNETSIMMALHPDLVHLEQLDGNPIGVGPLDPRTASPEFGEQALSLQLDHMTHTLERMLQALGEQSS